MKSFTKQLIFILVGVAVIASGVLIVATKKPCESGRFGVDPAGFAPALLGTNSSMLLYALRAQIHDFIINQKGLLLQDDLFVVPS